MARNLVSIYKLKWIPARRRTPRNKRGKRRQWKNEHRGDVREERAGRKGVSEGRSRPARRKPHPDRTLT